MNNSKKMTNQIETKGFRIVSPGDESVGIFQGDWDLTGPFFFENKDELEEFRIKLKEAFEYVSDDCYIETYEEREKYIREENEQLNEEEE